MTDAIYREELWARTEDGLSLAISRARPVGREKVPAVMLMHGLSGCRFAFDLPERSVMDYLARRGLDCFAVELRGAGQSDNPNWRWTMHDHLERDVPALIARILEISGQTSLAWVGHSMGGVLLYLYGIDHPEAPVSRAITLGASIDYSVGKSVFSVLLRFRPMLERFPVLPLGALARVYAVAAGRLPVPIERLHVNERNTDAHVTRAMYRRTLDDLCVPLLQSLASTYEPGGFRDANGRTYLDRVRNFRWPLTIMAGTADVQAPLETVQHTAKLFGADLRVLGRRYGAHQDYGHYDLLVGRWVDTEVWAVLAKLLREGHGAKTRPCET